MRVTVAYIVKLFIRTTSVDGLIYVGSGQRLLTRCLFAGVLLTCACMFIYRCVLLDNQFNAKNTVTQVKIFHEAQYFPAVTVCSMNPYKKSKVEQISKDIANTLKAYSYTIQARRSTLDGQRLDVGQTERIKRAATTATPTSATCLSPDESCWYSNVSSCLNASWYHGPRNRTMSGKPCHTWTNLPDEWENIGSGANWVITVGVPLLTDSSYHGVTPQTLPVHMRNVFRPATALPCSDVQQSCWYNNAKHCQWSNSYTGLRNITVSGKICKKWSDYTAYGGFYAGYGELNYCRNPDGKPSGPWCWTAANGTAWENCFNTFDQCLSINQSCYNELSGCYFTNITSCTLNNAYSGFRTTTLSGYACQAWNTQTPHTHPYSSAGANNMCKILGNRKMPWCYTKNPSAEWEYCYTDCEFTTTTFDTTTTTRLSTTLTAALTLLDSTAAITTSLTTASLTTTADAITATTTTTSTSSTAMMTAASTAATVAPTATTELVVTTTVQTTTATMLESVTSGAIQSAATTTKEIVSTTATLLATVTVLSSTGIEATLVSLPITSAVVTTINAVTTMGPSVTALTVFAPMIPESTTVSTMAFPTAITATSQTLMPPITASTTVVNTNPLNELPLDFDFRNLTQKQIDALEEISKQLNFQNQSIAMQSKTQQAIMALAAILEPEQVKSMSYSPGEMVINCVFKMHACDLKRDFTLLQDPNYGNCYTFTANSTSSNFLISKIGPESGLRMIIVSDSSDYIATTPAQGIKIAINDHNSYPLPEVFGITGPTGMSTSFALRKITYARLSEPYGSCITKKPGNYIYSKAYTVDGCYHSCYQSAVVLACNCGDPRFPIPPNAGNIRHCDPYNFQQSICLSNYTLVQGDYQAIKNCSCPEPCQEVRFHTTSTSSIWPTMNSVRCDPLFTKNKYNNETCFYQLRQKAAQVEIYFETLEEERNIDVPAYGRTRFVSDIAQELNLWLSFTAVVGVEFLVLFMQLLMLLLCGHQFNESSQPQRQQSPYDTQYRRQSFDVESRSRTSSMSTEEFNFRSRSSTMETYVTALPNQAELDYADHAALGVPAIENPQNSRTLAHYFT